MRLGAVDARCAVEDERAVEVELEVGGGGLVEAEGLAAGGGGSGGRSLFLSGLAGDGSGLEHALAIVRGGISEVGDEGLEPGNAALEAVGVFCRGGGALLVDDGILACHGGGDAARAGFCAGALELERVIIPGLMMM
jgi:hypothetical protein